VTILLYTNRKVYPPVLWDASTPEKRSNALLCLFRYLDEQWEVYDELKQPTPWDVDKKPKQVEWYERAAAGDAAAAERLLKARRQYEYELWDFVELEKV
jgi:hypothetical protein